MGFLPGSPKCEALRHLNETVKPYTDHLEDRLASLDPMGDEPVFGALSALMTFSSTACNLLRDLGRDGGSNSRRS